MRTPTGQFDARSNGSRLDTIPSVEQKMMVELDCSGFEGRDRFSLETPEQRRISLISTAALNMRDDAIYERMKPTTASFQATSIQQML